MKRLQLLCAVVCASLGASASAVLAHEGHDAAPGEEGEQAVGGPITITAEARTNLGLTVEEADLRTIETTLTAIGAIEAIPTNMAMVSSRIPGRVAAIDVVSGESVKKGQPVVEVESRQLGNPPPSVKYEAPIDGVVTIVEDVLGSAVEPDRSLLEIVNLSEVYAEGRIFEGQVASVKPGQKVRVYVESFPKEIFEGTINIVSGALDPESRTLRVWARLKNPESKLRPNMRARMSITTGEADSVVTVPHTAVLGDAGNLFVFAQEDADGLVYERRPVVTGMKDDRYVEIIEGVFPADKIVTEGNYQLQYVVPQKPATPATEPTDAHTDLAGAKETSAQLGAAIANFLNRPTALWSLIAVAVLLLLNLLVLFRRRRAGPEPRREPSIAAKSAVSK